MGAPRHYRHQGLHKTDDKGHFFQGLSDDPNRFGADHVFMAMTNATVNRQLADFAIFNVENCGKRRHGSCKRKRLALKLRSEMSIQTSQGPMFLTYPGESHGSIARRVLGVASSFAPLRSPPPPRTSTQSLVDLPRHKINCPLVGCLKAYPMTKISDHVNGHDEGNNIRCSQPGCTTTFSGGRIWSHYVDHLKKVHNISMRSEEAEEEEGGGYLTDDQGS